MPRRGRYRCVEIGRELKRQRTPASFGNEASLFGRLGALKLQNPEYLLLGGHTASPAKHLRRLPAAILPHTTTTTTYDTLPFLALASMAGFA
jgi:hypothetical protein